MVLIYYYFSNDEKLGLNSRKSKAKHNNNRQFAFCPARLAKTTRKEQ